MNHVADGLDFSVVANRGERGEQSGLFFSLVVFIPEQAKDFENAEDVRSIQLGVPLGFFGNGNEDVENSENDFVIVDQKFSAFTFHICLRPF
jgi:hypothetical protein